MAHEMTTDEIRTEFLDHLRAMVRYWASDGRAVTPLDKLNGLAFSFLVAIDGGAEGLSGAWHLVPDGSEEDLEDEEWDGVYPVNDTSKLKGVITRGVQLHNIWHDAS